MQMTDEEKTLNDGISAENGEMTENRNVKEGKGDDGLSEPVRGNFLSSDGRTAISFYTVEPEGVPRAIVQVSHGMSEYAGRYLEFGRYLAAHGIMFAANDHLGHGETARTADDLGFFAEKDGYVLLVEDLHKFTLLLKQKYPGTPLILFGHSMGSFLVRMYLSRYAEELAGAVICGTGGPGSPTGLGIAMADIISFFRGERHRSRLITGIAFGGYNKRFPKDEGIFAWTTGDPVIRKKYEDDPKSGFMFTVSGFRDLFRMIAEVSTDEWAAGVPTDLPILIVSGTEDPVGGYGKGVRKVAAMLGGAGAKRLTVRLFEGDRHEILNEKDRAGVMEFITGWIDGVLAGGPADGQTGREGE